MEKSFDFTVNIFELLRFDVKNLSILEISFFWYFSLLFLYFFFLFPIFYFIKFHKILVRKYT